MVSKWLDVGVRRKPTDQTMCQMRKGNANGGAAHRNGEK